MPTAKLMHFSLTKMFLFDIRLTFVELAGVPSIEIGLNLSMASIQRRPIIVTWVPPKMRKREHHIVDVTNNRIGQTHGEELSTDALSFLCPACTPNYRFTREECISGKNEDQHHGAAFSAMLLIVVSFIHSIMHPILQPALDIKLLCILHESTYFCFTLTFVNKVFVFHFYIFQFFMITYWVGWYENNWPQSISTQVNYCLTNNEW